QLFRSKDEHEKSLPNRWSTVRIECAQAGTPARSPLSDDCKRRRNTSSKKINCNWKVLCQWPQRTAGPYITQVHLTHDTTPEGGMADGKEHPPPRVFGDELSQEEIQQQELKIKELVEAGFGTTEIHKYLQRDGKRLGDQGKQKVRNLRRKYQEAKPCASTGLSSQAPSVVAPPETPRHIQPLPPPVLPLPPRESSAEPFGLGASMSLPLTTSSPSALVRNSPHGARLSSAAPGAGARSNGGEASNPSLEASRHADCVAFAQELASACSEIKSRDAMYRVIAHARVAALNAIQVELQCQGRRAAGDSWA
ncbi:unnamed protein product, partial [Ectocarpus fasciculatus]